MNFITSLASRFGFVTKSAAHAIAKRALFSAAAINRLTGDWNNGTSTMDSALKMELSIMRARARELVVNNPYANKFISMLKANVLGSDGLQLKNKASDPWKMVKGKVEPGPLDVFANKLVEDAWWDWGKRGNCTPCGKLSWAEVQAAALESCGTDGETVLRIYPGFPNKYRFAVALIETDMLDDQKNEQLPNGNTVRLGVERDTFGKPVAYYFFRKHPADYGFNYSNISQTDHERVPAELIVHAFVLRRIGQTRGFPWLAVTMLNLQMLGKYEEAELVAARTAASKMAFLKSTGDVQYQGPQDGGNPVMDAQPGVIETLPQGLEMQVLDWNHPNSNYGTFIKAALRGMAAGLNISYNTMANDLEGVNFSSGRMGQLDEREHWKFLQAWFGESFCNPVFKSWLFSALNLGLIPLPPAKFEKFNQPMWVGRRWSWVDPTKEVNAKIQELNCGLTSLTRVLAENGIDRDELLDEIADDKAALEARGIDLPELWQEAPDPIELEKAKAGLQPVEAPEDRSVHLNIHQPAINTPVNVTIPPEKRAVKRKVEFTRDEKGKPTGATVTEET